MKKKIISPITKNNGITFKVENNILKTEKKEIIFQEFLVKTYQITVKEIEHKDLNSNKKYEIIDKDWLEKEGLDISKALCVSNLIKLFQKNKHGDTFKDGNFIDELLSMYMLKPNIKSKSKKIKNKYLIKKIISNI